MTAKRFKLGYVCGDYGLIDNDEWIDLYSMSENSEKNVQICINKMNELAEKNEQLKKQREELFIRERDTKNDWRELKQENESLKEENKFLRNKVATYKKGNALLKKSMDKEWK